MAGVGIDITFARKPSASVEDARKLAASIKERLPFPMGITFGSSSAKESRMYTGFFEFESETMLPVQDPKGHLAEVVEAIHAILKEEGWEVKTDNPKSQPQPGAAAFEGLEIRLGKSGQGMEIIEHKAAPQPKTTGASSAPKQRTSPVNRNLERTPPPQKPSPQQKTQARKWWEFWK